MEPAFCALNCGTGVLGFFCVVVKLKRERESGVCDVGQWHQNHGTDLYRQGPVLESGRQDEKVVHICGREPSRCFSQSVSKTETQVMVRNA